MSIQLRLDAAAMNALFPEGSEARIELQNAVVAEFVHKHLSPKFIDEEVRRQIARAREDAVHDVIIELTKQGGWGSPINLGEKLKAIIKDEVRDQVNSQVKNDVSERVNKSLEQIPGDIKEAVERHVDLAVRKEVNAQVVSRVTNALNEALKGSTT